MRNIKFQYPAFFQAYGAVIHVARDCPRAGAGYSRALASVALAKDGRSYSPDRSGQVVKLCEKLCVTLC